MSRARGGWDDLGWDSRHDVMTFTVLPNMARLFQRFRQTSEPDLTCGSCHGADAESVYYKMPRGLPPLDPKRMPDPQSRDPQEARMARFMADEVTPQMAELLEVPRFDPRTRQGFSCFNCHPTR